MISGPVTLDGVGSVILEGSGSVITGAGDPTDALSNVGNTISGSGTIEDLAITNQSGGVLDLNGPSTLDNVTISGGQIIVGSGVTAVLDNVVLDTLTLTVNSDGTTPSIQIDAGDTLTWAGASSFGSGTAGGVSIIDNNGHIIHTGTLQLSFSTSTFEGTGTDTENGGNTGVPSTLINEGNTFDGYGQQGGGNPGSLTIINQAAGTFDADVAGHAFIWDAGASTITNQGVVEATNGATFEIESTVADDTTVVSNSGGNVEAGASSEVLLSNATIDGGTVSIAATSELVGSGTSAIDNATIDNSGSLETGGTFTLDDDTVDGGTITGAASSNNSVINVDAANTLTLNGVTAQGNTDGTGAADNSGTITLENTLTLAGTGFTLLLDDTGTVSLNGATIAGSNSGETLENNANTISGAGQIGNGNGDLTLQNDAAGTVTAQGGTLTIDAAVTNDGTMTAASGATLDLAGQVSGTGSTVIDAGGTAVVGALDSQAITYNGVGTLQITPTGNLTGAIGGLVQGDVIDFADNISITSTSISGSTLTVDESSGGPLSYTIGGAFAGEYFAIQSDGNGGDELVLSPITPAPTVTVLSDNVAPGADLDAGKSITFTVDTSEAVNAVGSALTLSNGATAAYTSGSGGSTLTFTYTVAAGDASTTDLKVTGYSGTIADTAGNALAAATVTENTGVAIVTTAPTVTTLTDVTSTGTTALDAGKSITFTVDTSEAVNAVGSALTLSNGATAAYTSGSGGSTLTFTYTVAAGDASTTDLKVTGYSGTIADTAGNALAAATVTENTGVAIVTTAPTVTTLTDVTSTGTTALDAGKSITFTVDTSEAVNAVGSALTLSNGATAAYTSGSGGSTLTFTYTVAAGDASTTDLKVTGYSGTIADTAGNALAAATVTENTGVAIVTTAPTVTTLTDVTSTGTTALDAGKSITFTVDTSEAVNAVGSALTLSNGATAAYTSGSGGSTLTFTYTVAAGDASTTDLKVTGYSGTIADTAGNALAAATVTENTGVAIVTTAPTVTTLTDVTSTGTTALDAGKSITFTVDTSEAVNAVGSALTLSNGATAAYTSGSGSQTLTFTYTVAAGDASTTDLKVTGYSGTIADTAGNALAAATVTENTGVAIVTTAPTVMVLSDVTSTGTTALDAGKSITFTVDTSEAVNAVGSALTLSNGATAAYTSGSGGSTLTFTYTVAAGDASTTDLKVTGYSGTIADTAGNALAAATVTENTGVAIVTTAPTVTTLTDVTSTGTTALDAGKSITFTVDTSEAVNAVGSALTLSNGATAAYTSGSGGSTLTFTYTVAAGDASTTDLKVTGYSGTIADTAGNALVAAGVNEDTGVAITTTAQTDDWINTSGGTWTDAANEATNWSDGLLPRSIDTVVIGATGSGPYTVVIPSGQTADMGSFTLDSANATLLVQGAIDDGGAFTIEAGKMVVESDQVTIAGATSNSGTIEIATAVTVGGPIANSGGIFQIDAGDTLTLSGSITGGTVTTVAGSGQTPGAEIVGTGAIQNATINNNGALVTGGIFTLDDDTINGGILTGDAQAASFNLDTNNTLTLNGVTVEADDNIVAILTNAGAVTLDSSLTLSPTSAASNSAFTLLFDGTGTVALNGATITATGSGEVLENNANTISGAGQIGNGNGDLSVQNDADGNITAQGGTLTIDAGVINNGTMTAESDATLSLNGTVSGSGSTVVDAGGTVVVNALDQQAITYDGVGTLQISPTGNLTGAINGLVQGDVIDFTNNASITSTSISGTTLTVNELVGGPLTYTIGGTISGDYFAVRSDGNSGTELVLDPATVAVAVSVVGNDAVQAGQILVAQATVNGDGADQAASVNYQWEFSDNGGLTWSAPLASTTTGQFNGVLSGFYQLTQAEEGDLVRAVASFTGDTGQVTTGTSTATGAVADITPILTVPFSYDVDSFTVIDGSATFDDTFGNGPPPVGGLFGTKLAAFATSAGGGGSVWTEVNGMAVMSSSGAAPNGINNSVQALLITNTDPEGTGTGESNSGLKENATFTASATFQLVVPAPGTGYGIDLTNGVPGSGSTEEVQLQVDSTPAGGATVDLLQSDPATDTFTVIANQVLSATQLANDTQIQLELAHTAGNETVVGSFALGSNGDFGASTTFSPSTAAHVFDDQTFTRAQIMSFSNDGVIITGAAQEGQTLTAETVTNDPNATINYQWEESANSSFSSGSVTDIGTDSATYVVQRSDENDYIRVVATTSDPSNPQPAATATSAATGPIIDDAALSVSTSVVSGAAVQIGQTLVSSATVAGDSSDLTAPITYQWQVSNNGGTTWSDVPATTTGQFSGQLSSFYQIGQADLGDLVRVQATFTDDTGQIVTAASTPTVAVAEIAPILTVPFSYAVDEFTVSDGLGESFADTFNNGPPPIGGLFGSTPLAFQTSSGGSSGGGSTWSEVGGQAVMSSSGAAYNGTDDSVQAILLTSNLPEGTGTGESNSGLKENDTFTVSGTFDLVVPQPSTSYGIELNEALPAPGTTTQQVQIQVFGTANGGAQVHLGERDPATGVFTLLTSYTLTAAQLSGNNQIELDLVHDTANSTAISGSFELIDNSTSTFGYTFSQTGELFADSTAARALIQGISTDGVLITGTAQQGQMLTAETSTNDPNATISFQWQESNNGGQNWTAIAGATHSTYTPQATDVGDTIEVVATAGDPLSQQSVTATSAPTGAVTALAQGDEWLNTSGGTWTDSTDAATNWSDGALPRSIDNVLIDLAGSGSYTVTIPNGATADAGSLTLNNANATLDVAGTLTIADALTIDAGRLVVEAGNDITVGTTVTNAGTLELATSAELPSITNTDGTIQVDAGDTLTLQGGTITGGTIDLAAGTEAAPSVTEISVPGFDSVAPAVSDNGQYTAFLIATNLPENTNNINIVGVELYDSANDQLTNISALVSSQLPNDLHPGENFSSIPPISADGQYVLFEGQYQVDNFNNGNGPTVQPYSNSLADIFLYNTQSQTVSLVYSAAATEGNPEISGNGQFIASVITVQNSQDPSYQDNVVVMNDTGSVLT